MEIYLQQKHVHLMHYNTLAKKIIELERNHNKQFQEVFKTLDALMEESKIRDEKVMRFVR